MSHPVGMMACFERLEPHDWRLQWPSSATFALETASAVVARWFAAVRSSRRAQRVDALRNYAIYGVFGVSVFALRDATIDELAQQPPLVRFAVLTVLEVAALRDAGLEIQPTGRNPRHFDIVFSDLDDGIGAPVPM